MKTCPRKRLWLLIFFILVFGRTTVADGSDDGAEHDEQSTGIHREESSGSDAHEHEDDIMNRVTEEDKTTDPLEDITASTTTIQATSASRAITAEEQKSNVDWDTTNGLNLRNVCAICRCLHNSPKDATSEKEDCGNLNCAAIKGDFWRYEFKCRRHPMTSCLQCTVACKSHKPDGKCIDSDTQDDEDLHECNCSKQSQKQPSVSTGVAIGLVFLGVVVGVIITATACICVPSLHSKTSVIRGKMTGMFHQSRVKEDMYQAPKDVHESITGKTLSAGPALKTDPDQHGYSAVNEVSKVRDSHTYSGLHPSYPGQREPKGSDIRYETIKIQTMGGPNAITSPVYKEFTDNVIPSTGNMSNMDNQNPITGDQQIKNTDTECNVANHNYFVLEAQNDADTLSRNGNGTSQSDHPYFVLEEQKGNQVYTDNTVTIEPNNHEYFLLEKEQT